MNEDEVRETVAAFAAAELSGDPAIMDPLLADNFVGVGPLGFLLSRENWLARGARGLEYTAYDIDELKIRGYGDRTAVVVGRQFGKGSHQGNPVPEQSRVTLVLDGPRVAHIHISFVAGTPGSPPIPGPQR